MYTSGGHAEFTIAYDNYLYVGLEQGKLIVSQLNGNKTANVTLTGSKPLYDGSFHKVLIVQTNKLLEVFIVDDCNDSTMSDCYATALADDDERLNVVQPLQVGSENRVTRSTRITQKIGS